MAQPAPRGAVAVSAPDVLAARQRAVSQAALSKPARVVARVADVKREPAAKVKEVSSRLRAVVVREDRAAQAAPLEAQDKPAARAVVGSSGPEAEAARAAVILRPCWRDCPKQPERKQRPCSKGAGHKI